MQKYIFKMNNKEGSRKPSWIRGKYTDTREALQVKETLRRNLLNTVCEEASCPNIGECFKKGTATFIIMGNICTRKCPFCNVPHGKPSPIEKEEPHRLAEAVSSMKLNHVVITSVNRDDLQDGGASHFAKCIDAIRKKYFKPKIEILVPDFRDKVDLALNIFQNGLPDVFNHNLETIPRFYPKVRPGANYHDSLSLLKKFKDKFSHVPTKSGLMLGLGETPAEVYRVMRDLRYHDCDILTLGQYLRPSSSHLPVAQYIHPSEFDQHRKVALEMGFSHVASAPLVRSSYNAASHSRIE